MNTITVMHVTKKKYIELFGKERFYNYRDAVAKGITTGNSKMYYFDDNKEKYYLNDSEFFEIRRLKELEEQGYAVLYMRQVLTEKWEYR